MKIQLPDFVLADLYKNSLVVTGEIMSSSSAAKELKTETESMVKLLAEPEAETEVKPETEPWFLGGNAKQVSVLVHSKRNRFLDEESLQLLSNMLAAVQLTIKDVAVINMQATPVDYKALAEQLQPRICLMFGVTTQQIQLPFMMPDYKVQVFSNCTFLCSASLDQMKGKGNEARVEKTKLWQCLKSIFE